MSILLNPFPTHVVVDSTKVRINSDFRTVLKCFAVQGRKAELDEKDLSEMLVLFYRKPRKFSAEHIEKMFWFFACGKEESKKKFPRKIAGINNKQPFDFEEDAELIYAGFMQQYHIDLQKTKMHWWKFMILLENLGSGTRLQKVMEYRTIDTENKNLSSEEKDFYKAMQRYYGLNTRPEMSDRLKKIEEALLNGGDVSVLLESDFEQGGE